MTRKLTKKYRKKHIKKHIKKNNKMQKNKSVKRKRKSKSNNFSKNLTKKYKSRKSKRKYKQKYGGSLKNTYELHKSTNINILKKENKEKMEIVNTLDLNELDNETNKKKIIALKKQIYKVDCYSNNNNNLKYGFECNDRDKLVKQNEIMNNIIKLYDEYKENQFGFKENQN